MENGNVLTSAFQLLNTQIYLRMAKLYRRHNTNRIVGIRVMFESSSKLFQHELADIFYTLIEKNMLSTHIL